MELKTFSVDNVTNKEKVDSSLAENYEPKKQEIQKKESQEDETQVILIENHLQQSSDSLRTEVQARDLNREDLDTDSGSADTSTTLRDPPQNLSLVLHNVVCEETEVQPNSEGESDPQQITFDAEVHQDGNEEVSDSPDSPIMNLFPTFNTPPYPMYSAEPDSVENGVPVYTQPLADTSGESSQLLVTYTCVRPDLRRNGLENCTCNSSPTMTRDRNGVDESSILPLQNTDNSQARLVVGEVNCSSLFHPDDLWDRYHQHDDRTNTVQYRQLMTEVVGGSESLSNELEPNNDRHLTVNANVVRQISADNEHLTSDPDVLRQLSTDSEESRG